MNQKVEKQNSFFQSRVNRAKLGAYYTDPEHCKWIAELLEFPTDEEVCCLEPAIGNGEAAIIVTGRKGNSDVHIFGVELNEATAELVSDNPLIDDCIYGDFMTDAIISKNVFSLCFSNPPYGELDGNRIEWIFLNRIIPYLKNDAVFVFVVPYYVASMDSFLQVWCSNFSTECGYRFHDKEFEKWKQIVLIGRKVKKHEVRQCETKKLREQVGNPDHIPLLPEHYNGEKIRVNPSYNRDITDFRSKEFNEKKARRVLRNSPFEKMVLERVEQQKFMTDRLSRPPIMPNAGQMYLMAISGAGMGRVGDEQSGDLHLQRGVVENVEESEIRLDENGNKVESVQKYSQVHFNIIEDNGTIHRL